MTVSDKFPRLTIGGLRGGSGKTVLTLGLIGSLRERSVPVMPWKKGPDYIDPAWLSLAARHECRCLDTFLMGADCVRDVFRSGSRPGVISLIEGNRGLFDGVDSAGTHSTAELAKLLKSPVVLAIDCTKTTRTIAALVLGCKEFDPELNLAGVVLNQVASARQEKLVRQAVKQYASTEVLGAMPRIQDFPFAERHLGLVPPPEHSDSERVLSVAREAVEGNVDVDRLLEIAGMAGQLEPVEQEDCLLIAAVDERPRIGVIRDSAFNFYYPENLEQLEGLGAELVFVNALEDPELPLVDALYIGGGFPETHAERLAANESFRQSIRCRVESGLPVYAECGGLTYLGDAIVMNGTAHPMAGVFPLRFEIATKPQGHGYVVMQVDAPNPFFETGTTIRGHEFRYSRPLDYEPASIRMACCVTRGRGFDGGREGLCYKNVFASFCHVHALGLRNWADALVGRALQFRQSSAGSCECDGRHSASKNGFACDGFLARNRGEGAMRMVIQGY